MTATSRKLALVATATVAVLGITGGGLSQATAAIIPGDCAGMKVPTSSPAANQAPVAVDDTATAVAGGTAYIKPLANDSDPDGNRIAIVNTTTPVKGQVCIDSTGTVEYVAAASSAGYTATFRYGVTDGDFYRTAKVTVTVQGVKPMRASLLHRLVKRNGHVKHPAQIEFTNPNHRAMLVVAGDPRKKNPTITRGLGVGRSLAFESRGKKLAFIIGVATGNGEIALVDFGQLNTVNGRQQVISAEDFASSDLRTMAGRTPVARWTSHRALAQHWLRFAARH